MLTAFRELRARWPRCLLVLAPRHPHRGDALARQLSNEGWRAVRRAWNANESMYRAMVGAGARVPDAKPVLRLGDRGPMLAVAMTVAVIAGFIAYLLWAASTGNL